jgi:hypothetical protein
MGLRLNLSCVSPQPQSARNLANAVLSLMRPDLIAHKIMPNTETKQTIVGATRPSVRLSQMILGRGVLTAAIASVLAGCSSSLAPSPLGFSLTTPTGTQTVVPSSAIDAYSAVARGALVCWVGADGPLKTTHIFHADVAAPASGGAAEIILHQRDPTQPSPRGAKALRVTIVDDGSGGALVNFENLKLPADLADAMRRDTFAWARLAQSCEAQVVRPPAPAAPPVAAKPAKKPIKRT